MRCATSGPMCGKAPGSWRSAWSQAAPSLGLPRTRQLWRCWRARRRRSSCRWAGSRATTSSSAPATAASRFGDPGAPGGRGDPSLPNFAHGIVEHPARVRTGNTSSDGCANLVVPAGVPQRPGPADRRDPRQEEVVDMLGRPRLGPIALVLGLLIPGPPVALAQGGTPVAGDCPPPPRYTLTDLGTFGGSSGSRSTSMPPGRLSGLPTARARFGLAARPCLPVDRWNTPGTAGTRANP